MSDGARISHNLRTPLTAIRLIIDLCLRRGETLPPDLLKEFLSCALEQTKKLELAILETERDALSALLHEEDDVIVLHEESPLPIRVAGRKVLDRI